MQKAMVIHNQVDMFKVQFITVSVLAGKVVLRITFFSDHHFKGSIWLLQDDQICNPATVYNYPPEGELSLVRV